MFRPMNRPAKQLPAETCIDILKTGLRGVLSLLGDGDYPYGLPIDYWYCPEDGKLYFHCGREGHKIDSIHRCDKASFCVLEQGCREPGHWALKFRSVIVFGRVEILKDPKKAIEITRQLSCRFTSDSDFIEGEIQAYGADVLVFSLTPEHITGKQITES